MVKNGDMLKSRDSVCEHCHTRDVFRSGLTVSRT